MKKLAYTLLHTLGDAISNSFLKYFIPIQWSLCLVLCLATFDSYGQHTVTGKIVYGTIDESDEDGNGDYRATSIFSRGLESGKGVPHVRVELVKTGFVVDFTYTDSLGRFTLESTKTFRTPNKLRVRAENEYCTVKIPAMPSSIRADFRIDDEDYTDAEVDHLGDFSINDGEHYTIIQQTIARRMNVSRALFIAGAAYRGCRHIEELTGTSLLPVLPDDDYKLTVRYPANVNGDYFNRYLNTIFLQHGDAYVIDHELGHFIEYKIGAFGNIPDYLLTGGHDLCSVESECWAFLEGLASWYGAVNSVGYVEVDDVDFYGDPIASNYFKALGYSSWIEWDSCGLLTTEPTMGPENNEGAIAQILWDLVDDSKSMTKDTSSPLRHDPKIPEIAKVDIRNILTVLTATIPSNSPCEGWDSYKHPVTIEQFCETYIDSFPADVYPDLYSAFAFNGISSGCVEDISAPEAPSLHSSTHEAGVWSNDNNLIVYIQDGADDFSGSYYYYDSIDTNPTTDIGFDAYLKDPFLESKYTTNRHSFYIPNSKEGANRYLHIKTADLAKHYGATGHFGPLNLDFTDPEINQVEFPDVNDDYLIGTYVEVSWEVSDALSGVDYVTLSYSDPTNGVEEELPASSIFAKGSMEFYLNPDVVVPSTTGRFVLTVYDKAGNSCSDESANLTIVSPFEGPHDFGFDLGFGRVVSGDLDNDGKDEIVLSGGISGKRYLRVVNFEPAMDITEDDITDLSPGMLGGDLFLADTDRDGDLDIIAGGFYGVRTRYQIYVHQNDGLGNFSTSGPLPIADIEAMKKMVIRVVDLYGTGEPILIFGGEAEGIDELGAYNLVSGTLTYLDGVEMSGGDFEIGDINADGVMDFVTLGYDASGSGSVRVYFGEYTENKLVKWSEVDGMAEEFLEEGDVDLGNWDDDRDLELFMMYQVSTGDEVEYVTGIWDWLGSGFVQKVSATSNSMAIGDGHFVDIYNDGRSDVLALGGQIGEEISYDKLLSWYLSSIDIRRHEGSGVPVPVRNKLLKETDTAFGDFDGDGDLDMVVTGKDWYDDNVTLWYENTVSQYLGQNEAPAAVSDIGLFYDYDRGGYVISWSAPDEDLDETAVEEFQYEIQVGTAEGLGDVVSWAHPAGHRQQVAAQIVLDRYERFVDIPEGNYHWNIRTVDNGWKRSAPVSLAEGRSSLPDEPSDLKSKNTDELKVSLFPNPATDYLQIKYSLDKSREVQLTILDLSGRTLWVLENTSRDSGTYNVRYDGSELPEGVYLLQLRTEATQLTEKFEVIKR